MKDKTLKRWKELTWQALSKWKRASGVCQRCGKVKEPRQLDAHHLVHKSKGLYAKFEPDNIVALCGFYCHRNWWHGKAGYEEQMELIEKWIGLDRYNEIRQRSFQKCSYTVDDYKRMIAEFTEKYNEVVGQQEGI